MTANPVTVQEDTEITEAARLMLDKGFNGLPVIDSAGLLRGIICQSDLVTKQKRLNVPSVFSSLGGFISFRSQKDFEKEMRRIAASSVRDAMTEEVVAVTSEATIEDVATLMVDQKLHTLPVVDEGKLVGVIGKEDVLRTLLGSEPE